MTDRVLAGDLVLAGALVVTPDVNTFQSCLTLCDIVSWRNFLVILAKCEMNVVHFVVRVLYPQSQHG